MILFGGNANAQTTGGSELSLDDVNITSFKIIDVYNGNREIDYRTSDDAQFTDYKNNPSKFTNALDEGQKTGVYKLSLALEYASQEALKEGDTLTIPANLGYEMSNFDKQVLKDGEGHNLGTWEYKNGKVIINFSGDYIQNNRVTKFKATFETGDNTFHLSAAGKTFNLGERRIQEGQLGNKKIIVAREKEYIKAEKINNTTSFFQKYGSADSDKTVNWLFAIKGDTFIKKPDNTNYYNPYLIENEGKYSPKTYTDIYLEDTFEDVTKAPSVTAANVWVSGTNDDGKVISGGYLASFPLDLLTEVKQGSLTREEMKAALQKGQYVIYKNQDGTYTFMMKWWNMNDETGPTYDDLPQIKAAGGVGSYLKSNYSNVFGSISDETVLKINSVFKGKAIQNVYLNLKTEHTTALERKEIPNTLKFETAQGIGEAKYTAIITPSAGLADAPADPLSIKLLKTDVETGTPLSEGFKFELQTTDDNGATWKPVTVTANMVVTGTLNGDNTLTPNEKGAVEVNSLIGGKKYRFVEKAHGSKYQEVKEDNAKLNTNKTPTVANSRVVEISNQGTGKVIVMYNQQKPETVKVEGTKTWDDADNQDGKRPAQITVNLLKNGQKVASKTVTEADGWKWTFDNLEKSENGKEITYTVEEEAVEGYTTKVNGFNITNTYTPAKTSVQVTKKWNDADDKDGKRPTSVTITLYANGEKTDKTLVLNKENNWTGSFTEVDEYKAGKKIDYSVQEEPVGNGYVSEISGDQAGGFTVTNTRKPDAPVTTETPTTPTTPVTTTTEDRGEELPNTGTTASLAVIGFLALIGAVLVLSIKTKKA